MARQDVTKKIDGRISDLLRLCLSLTSYDPDLVKWSGYVSVLHETRDRVTHHVRVYHDNKAFYDWLAEQNAPKPNWRDLRRYAPVE